MKKILEEKARKAIKYIYKTPKNQYWVIFSNRKKKRISSILFKELEVNRNKVISYDKIKTVDKIMTKKIKCLGITKKGLRCSRLKLFNTEYCFQHSKRIISKPNYKLLSLKKNPEVQRNFTFIDLFSGMGSFHYVLRKFGGKCVLAVDNNIFCNNIYLKNFGIESQRNILELNINNIPSHTILCGGFPCQPFSVAGLRKGFLDKRTNVIFKIFEILEKKKPRFVVLENVKGLLNHDKGKTFSIICNNLKSLSYFVKFQVLNTKIITNIPQNRERLFIICFKNYIDYCNFDFNFDIKDSYELKSFLQSNVPKKYYYNENSKIYDILKTRVVKSIDTGTVYQYRRGIVRENKSKVCPTLTAQMGTGGHNVPIIKDSIGIRKLTPNECLNLQGFLNYDISGFSDSNIYNLCGNSITVNVLDLIFSRLLKDV